MNRTKPAIKLFGLCAFVLALMGIASSSVQAVPLWLVLKGTEVVEEGEVTLAKDNILIVHTIISKVSVLFQCEAIAAVGIKLAAGGKTANGGKVKFSGCKAELNGSASSACEPVAGGTEKGVINTKASHAILVLHKFESGTTEELEEVVPDEGTTFATIEINKECSIGTKVPIIGKLFFKDCQSSLLVHKEIHLVEAGPLTRLFAISETEEHATSILGSVFKTVKIGPSFRSWAAHV